MNESSPRSFGKTVVAALVFLVAAWLLLGVVIHVLSFVFSTLLFILAVAAVVWALRVLLQPARRMAYVIIAVCFGLAGGYVGRIKGSSFWLWFLISGAVPVLGLLAAILYRFERDELRRQCPTCGRVTKIYDAVCTRCGAELDFPEVALAPESLERTTAPR